MTLRRLALALVAVPVCTANAQGFAAEMLRANAADSTGEHARAVVLYEQAYSMSGFDPLVLALAAQSAASAGMADRALRDLGDALDQGLLEPRLLADTSFASIRADRRWKALDLRLHRKLAALDQPLRAELLRLAEQDQRNRDGITTVLARYGSQSPQGDSAMRAMTAADAPIQARVRAIIAQHGWPGRTLVADDGSHAAWLVVQHMPHDYQAGIVARVEAAVRARELRAGDGALLKDRVLVGSHQPQVYGTQLSNAPSGGPPSLDPIVDERCVDVRRRQVGLEPLAAYLKGFGIAYRPAGTCPAGSGQEPGRATHAPGNHGRPAATGAGRVDRAATPAFAVPRLDIVYLRGGSPLDRVCADEFHVPIDGRTLQAAVDQRPSFQRQWDLEGPAYMNAAMGEIGIAFPYAEMQATLTVCLRESTSIPLLIDVRPFLQTSEKPVPAWEFTEIVFHELMHTCVSPVLGRSELMKKYLHEPPTVRYHLHVMALEKMVLLKLNRQDELTIIDHAYRTNANADYRKAWEIVDDIEGCEPFTAELKALGPAHDSARISNGNTTR